MNLFCQKNAVAHNQLLPYSSEIAGYCRFHPLRLRRGAFHLSPPYTVTMLSLSNSLLFHGFPNHDSPNGPRTKISEHVECHKSSASRWNRISSALYLTQSKALRLGLFDSNFKQTRRYMHPINIFFTNCSSA